MALYLLVPWEMPTPILIFLHFFVFDLRARTGQTDGRTDGQDTRCSIQDYSLTNIEVQQSYYVSL